MAEVPIKTVLHGNMYRARQQEHHGVRLITILERFMDFQGLKQCSMRKEIEPGLVVEASKVFGLRRIDVYVGGEPVKKRREVVECLCNCDFAFGFVVAINPELLDDEFQLYDVAVCFQRRKFILRENILASDFTKYVEWQKVLLVPYNSATFECCTATSPAATGCRPKPSKLPLANEDWRSAMRIIPWCGATIPKWVKRREV